MSNNFHDLYAYIEKARQEYRECKTIADIFDWNDRYGTMGRILDLKAELDKKNESNLHM